MSDQPSPATFYGRHVVAAAFVIAAFGWGVGFYGPPVYLEAVRQARGWPIALVSGAVTLHFLAGAGVVANLPRLYRYFGLPPVTFAGAVILALGVFGWAIAQAPWHLYAAALLSGAGWPALGAAAVNAIIAPWFVVKRPAALSMAYNGASAGGVMFTPIWVALIGRFGFPVAALVIAGGMLVTLGALSIRVLGRTPESLGQAPDGQLAATGGPAETSPASGLARRLIQDRAFLTLSLGMALSLFAQIGLIAHLVSVLVPVLGQQRAALAASFATSAAVGGRLLVGWFMPFTADRRRVAASSLILQAFGCLVLLFSCGAGAPLLLGLVLFGTGIGNATSLPPLIAQVEFARGDALRVVALIVAISQGTYAFAPAVFGLLRALGSDDAIFGLAAGLQAAAACIYLIGRSAHGQDGPCRR